LYMEDAEEAFFLTHALNWCRKIYTGA